MKLKCLLLISSLLLCFSAQAETINSVDVKWKTESQVRDLYGEPMSIHGPIGTHASYTLWKYEDAYVAFSNNRAFHRFSPDSLKKIELIDSK